jgi:hypothetical protein
MTNVLFLAFLLGLVVLLALSVRRASIAAAKITAAPDPVRVATMQYEAIAMALATVETLAEPPETKAKRRQALIERQKNLQLTLAA